MKKLVCVLGGVFPYSTPNSRIALNVLTELNAYYDITLVALNTSFTKDKPKDYCGMKIIYVNNYNQMFHNYFNYRINNSHTKLEKLFFKFLLSLKRVLNFGIRLFRFQSVSRGLIRKIKLVLKDIKETGGIDMIMPVSEPHEAIIAATEFQAKNRETILIPYKLDRFAEGNSLYETKMLRRIKYRRHQRTEVKTLKSCDALFVLPPIGDYYLESELFCGLRDKVIITEHPLLNKPLSDKTKSSYDHFVISYAGSFDLNLRNPDYLLRVVSRAFDSIDNYDLHLYSFGNCQRIIEKFTKSNKRILNHGKIPSNEIPGVLTNSDILLTVGNNSDGEVPSKLFEYLSYGKPIIHFYYMDNDAYIKYLSEYPFALLIKIDGDVNDNAQKLAEFCKENIGKSISYNEISRIYYKCTPQYVASQFKAVIDKQPAYPHSVVVAHPTQQHSMELARGLKDNGLLFSYLTTVYYSQSFLDCVRKVSCVNKSLKSKLSRKGNLRLDYSVKCLKKSLALLYYTSIKINYRFSCFLYVALTKSFGIKVAKYSIKNNVKAVIMYDYTAVACFDYLKKHAPNIVRIIDMSSIPAKAIDGIITKEEEKGFGNYFVKKRMRYEKKYCDYFNNEMKLANAFISPSNYVDRKISEYGSKQKIYRAMYGVDLSAFKYKHRCIDSSCDINFVFAGRVEGPKGVFYLFDAFDKIFQTRKDFKLHIVGVNCIEDSYLSSREYIQYHGFVNRDELISLYNEMHVFVLPSLWEGLSLSVLEAMSCGLCMLISDSTGCDDIVDKYNAGIIVRSQDNDSLKNAIAYLLEHKEEISKYSLNSQKGISDHSWASYRSDVASAVNKILEDMSFNS